MPVKSTLKRAVDLLEENGFHVSRAYEENYRDAGNPVYESSAITSESLTGAVILRITPKTD